MSSSMPLRGGAEYAVLRDEAEAAFVAMEGGADMFSLPHEGAEMGRSQPDMNRKSAYSFT